MGQKLIIRADATTAIGIGHIMRCIALAQAWQEKGGSVTFLSHCQGEVLRRRIRDEGFEFVYVDRPHPDPADLKQVIARLKDSRNGTGGAWLALDGYHFGPDYQKSVRKAAHRLMVIDDQNHLPYYHANVLLNQNIGADQYQYETDSDTELFLGTKYVMLRKEFLKQKRKERKVPKFASKILVTLGGADPGNILFMILDGLNLLDNRGIETKIAVGPAYLHFENLRKRIKRNRTIASTLQIVRNADMPNLMIWADVALSAGGSTCWELAFMRLPFLVLILADNQERIALGLEKNQIALNCGWFHTLSAEDIAERLEWLIDDSESRTEYSARGRYLVDGLGAERIVKYLMEL